MLHSILRPFAFVPRTLSRLPAFFFGSLKFAWTPPPWLRAAGRGIATHWQTFVVLLILSAGVAYGAWRMNHESEQRNPRPILIAAAADTTPTPPPASPLAAPSAPAAKPAAPPAPKSDPDVRDTSKPREIGRAHV